LANSPGDPDGPELPDLFIDAVQGLRPSDHEWMLLSSVVKDGVTAFEVYLEKAANEVRRVHGLADLEGRRGFLNWGDLRGFYQDHLQLNIDSAEVEPIRKLRHLLTHSRGKLRTEADRRAFGDQSEVFPSHQAKLSQDRWWTCSTSWARRCDRWTPPCGGSHGTGTGRRHSSRSSASQAHD
jgi:hypothetical protein